MAKTLQIGIVDETDTLDLRQHNISDLTDFLQLRQQAIYNSPKLIEKVKLTHYQDAVLQFSVRGVYEHNCKWRLYGSEVIAENE